MFGEPNQNGVQSLDNVSKIWEISGPFEQNRGILTKKDHHFSRRADYQRSKASGERGISGGVCARIWASMDEQAANHGMLPIPMWIIDIEVR